MTKEPDAAVRELKAALPPHLADWWRVHEGGHRAVAHRHGGRNPKCPFCTSQPEPEAEAIDHA